MFPLYDETHRKSFPFINYLLIASNIYMFYLQVSTPDFEQFVYQYAFIPAEFSLFNPLTYFYVFTSIFLHGSLFHILSNMWFLHIFGDNVEDRFGHIRYLLFYLAAGIFATLGQYLIDPSSQIPMIGASGAVSGAAGAYFVLFRNSKVRTLVPFFGFISLIDLSAGFVLGYWFITQVFSGLGAMSSLQEGGVAWFAHIGGFIFGYIVARSYRSAHTPPV
jgi:membrane associated rhomboid family serine protease